MLFIEVHLYKFKLQHNWLALAYTTKIVTCYRIRTICDCVREKFGVSAEFSKIRCRRRALGAFGADNPYFGLDIPIFVRGYSQITDCKTANFVRALCVEHKFCI